MIWFGNISVDTGRGNVIWFGNKAWLLRLVIREKERTNLVGWFVVICERESERCLKALYYLKSILIQRQSRELQ